MIDYGILDPEGKQLNPLTLLPYSDRYKELAKSWSTLSAYHERTRIIDGIEKNKIVLVQSETGSGKTVLIPKFALHTLKYEGRVAVTIPKKSSVESSAIYASLTLDVPLGGKVGYKFVGSPKSSQSNDTQLLYLTDGLLLSMLIADPLLNTFDIVIIDEAHERKNNIDILMLLLKRLILSGMRPHLKLIIMSATIDLEKYKKYFAGLTITDYKLSGSTNYPVKTMYEPSDKKVDLVARTKQLLNNGEKGNILVFVNSGAEAKKNCRLILPSYPHLMCAELYSKMTPETFDLTIQSGKYKELGKTQKLIYSTNAGESSITIPDLDVVLDQGTELEAFFHPDIFGSSLHNVMITKAQAIQRAGRVGRSKPGVCYRLYTKEHYDKMPEFPSSEIRRSDITIEILRGIKNTENKTYSESEQLFSQLIDPPTEKQLLSSKKLCLLYGLLRIGEDPNVLLGTTEIGDAVLALRKLPLNQSMFVIYADRFGYGRDASIIAGCLDVLEGKIENLFYPVGLQSGGKAITKNDGSKNNSKRRERDVPPGLKYLQDLATEYKSDHLAIWNFYEQYRIAGEAGRDAWAKKMNVKIDVMKKILKQVKMIHYIVKTSLPKRKKETITPSITTKVDTNKELELAIKTALKYSHIHMTANHGKLTYDKHVRVFPGSVTFLNSHKNMTDLPMIFYSLNSPQPNQWNIEVVTIIDPEEDLVSNIDSSLKR